MSPVVLLLCWLAAAGAAEDGVSETRLGGAKLETSLSPGQVAANFFLLPLAYAYSLEHRGFEKFPYEDGPGYGLGGKEWGASLRAGGQALPGGRAGGHAELAVRGSNRLGWRASWDGFSAGSLGRGRRADLLSAHIACNYAQTGKALFELGLGAATLSGPERRSGPSGALFLELFPRKPLGVSLAWQAAALGRRAYHQLSARAAVHVLGGGLFAGYRVFLGPESAAGPELGLAAWF